MPSSLVHGIIWYAVFLFSTICHEAAHAWSARRLGDSTAADGGQASLNPWPHVRREPFGMVLVPLISWLAAGWMIGWASAPYDPVWARNFPKRAALMALAGPAANLALAICAGLLIRVGLEWHVLAAPWSLSAAHMVEPVSGGPVMDIVTTSLSVLLALNLLLCVFNLFPLPPLDGSNVPLLVLPGEWAEKYSNALRSPLLRYGGLFLASRLLSPLFPFLLKMAARVLYPHADYG